MHRPASEFEFVCLKRDVPYNLAFSVLETSSMRTNRTDPFLNRMRDSLSMPRKRRTHLKLVGSMSLLAVVLVFAAMRQFSARGHDPLREPVGVENTEVRERTAPTTDRAVFGKDADGGNADTDSPRPAALPGDSEDAAPPAETERERSEPPKAASKANTEENTTGSASDVPGGVQAFLDEWRDTLIAGDADAQARLYAPKVERFFTKTGVSREAVRREKASLLARYPTFHKYDIRDVRVEEMKGDRARVTFDKEWDARGTGRFAGAERQRLTLQRTAAGGWQIVREEELKVYWVRRDRRS